MLLVTRSVYVLVLALVIYAVRLYSGGTWCQSQARIDGKTVIVTGANTGIGKETALDLVRRGGRVILACRSVKKGNEAAADIRRQLNMNETENNIVVMKLDLASLSSVRLFVEEFKRKESRLDILINNAGVAWIGESRTEDGFETTFGVNHLGHFLLTNLLLDMLKSSAPSRIVIVSSVAHEWCRYNSKTPGIQFDDLMFDAEYSMYFTYFQSKLANVMFSRHLSKLLQGSGVTTYSLHPGYIRTEIGRDLTISKTPILNQLLYVLSWPFVRNPTEGAQTQICCAVDENLASDTGKYYSDCAEIEPSSESKNEENAQRLWDISVKLVKL